MRVAADGAILYRNRAAIQAFQEAGWDGKDSLPAEWQAAISRALAGGAPLDAEFQFGSRIYACKFAPIPKEAYVNIYALEITEQKATQARLSANEALKAAILESALDCIITIDHEGRVVE